MERELTVRHVFVGFVERRNLESRMLNSQPFQMSPVGGYCILLYFSLLAEAQSALQ